MAGRFRLLADEHWSKAHVSAALEAGWEVERVVDALGQKTDDVALLDYCAAQGRVWVTSDERALAHVARWLASGRDLPGVLIAPQRHRMSPGAFVRSLERLAAESNPFAGVVRFLGRDE